MNVEQTLTDELRVVASSLETPPPPAAAALVHEAEKTRTSTRLRGAAITLAAAAAVVGAVVAGGQLGRPDSAPSPTHPTPTATEGSLPTGPAPRLPYVLDGTLYMNGEAQPGRWGQVTTAGRTSVAMAGEEGSDGPLVVFHDGVEVARLSAAGTLDAVLSPRGTKLAWIEFDDDSAELVVHDMDTGRDLGRLPVDRTKFSRGGEENEGWETVQKVDDDGTVAYGSVLVFHTWKPGSAPVDHDPAGYMNPMPEGFPQRAGYVLVSPDGTWGAWQTDRTGDPAPADEDAAYDGITLQHPGDPASRFTIALPPGADARQLIWESSTDVLVLVFGDVLDGLPQEFLRCDVVERTCEHASTPAGQ